MGHSRWEAHNLLSPMWGHGDVVSGTSACPVGHADWSALAKQIVCKGTMAKAVESWQIMMWGLTQAGNRAGKTARYLQWQGNRPEGLAVTSALDNWYHSTFLRQRLALQLAWWSATVG